MTSELPSVAIVGGGFSGLMTLYQLVHQADRTLHIDLIEPGIPGQGLAYGTHDPEHLLNVRADRMGALAGDPDHFWRWAASDAAAGARELLQSGQEPAPERFAPRRFYAAYLQGLWEEACALAKMKKIEIIHHRQALESIGVEKALKLHFPDRRSIAADLAILAIGNLEAPHAVRRFPALPDGSPFILPSAWDGSGEADLREAAGRLDAESTIFILGTGLTMVDTVLSLERIGYRGGIVALSRNGRLPLPHAAQGHRHYTNLPVRLSALMRTIKKTSGGDWRAAVDGLRPHTVSLWMHFSVTEKKRFLKRLFTLWNIHRHRMAPQIHARMETLQASGRLRIVAGQLGKADVEADRLLIDYTMKDGENRHCLADRVISCTGPGYDVLRNPHPLLQRLLRDGIVQPHPTKAGLAVQGFWLEGRAGQRLLGIGTVLIGERLETTAVPELREQAAQVASEALRTLSYRR